MSDPQAPHPDERDRRIEALRALAQDGAQASAPPQATAAPGLQATGPRSRKTLVVVAITAIALVAIVGGLLARAMISSSSAPQQQTSVSRAFQPVGVFTCPKDIAWSPDGATVALLGYQRNCALSNPGYYSYHPGDIQLYDATTGKTTVEIQPDRIIADALRLRPPTIATPMPGAPPSDRDTSQQAIDYGHILWSPDGKQLAVTFSVLLATEAVGDGDFKATTIQGVLLRNASGGETHVLSHALADGERYSGLWNLKAGAYIPLAGSPSPRDPSDTGWNADPALLPPALRYQWGSDGRLQPVTPLDETSAPVSQLGTPVGQPDGGKDFSVWQPGLLELISRIYSPEPGQAPEQLKTPIETWQTTIAAWSADGAYLFAGDQGQEIWHWRIPLTGQPSPDVETLTRVGLIGAPQLPVRDAAMAAVLQRYHDTSLNPNAGLTLLYLAWSPDGKRLAVQAEMPPKAGLIAPKDFAVSVYDCASGKALGTLTPTLGLGSGAGIGIPQTFLRWSPDGSHLLLSTAGLNGVQVWGAKDLPH